MMFFTFGSNSPFCNHYVAVDTKDDIEAREVMQEIFQRRWAFDYTEAAFRNQPGEYGLARLCLIQKTRFGNWRAVKELEWQGDY